jgi:hypothetical protein
MKHVARLGQYVRINQPRSYAHCEAMYVRLHHAVHPVVMVFSQWTHVLGQGKRGLESPQVIGPARQALTDFQLACISLTTKAA